MIFLINPISGGKKKSNFSRLVMDQLNLERFNPDFLFTEGIGHAFELARHAVAEDTDVIVAVGGDGTINEIASALTDSGKSMGIVPLGSGNGLARALGLPMSTAAAIEKLNKGKAIPVDTATVNGKHFFNMAGMGFDAHISTIFATDKKRGMGGYLKAAFSEVLKFKPDNYRIEVDGKRLDREAFMVSIANSSQFGNNVHIAPSAEINDGLLDVCILKPFPLYEIPNLGGRMLSKTIDQSKYLEIVKGKEINIHRDSAGPVHLDGEPMIMDAHLNIKISPLSLSVIT